MPVSDGTGVVVQVGPEVREFKEGDIVMTIFNQGHQYGDIDPYAASTGVGGTIDGVLRQYGVYDESGLVKAPRNLSALESSTLPGAALTSWNALYGLRPVKAGQYVLVQGTGGVSVFGLQVCLVVIYNAFRLLIPPVQSHPSITKANRVATCSWLKLQVQRLLLQPPLMKRLGY